MTYTKLGQFFDKEIAPLVGENLQGKQVFGLSGRESLLATLEAESAEEKESTPSYGDRPDYFDMTGAGGPDDER